MCLRWRARSMREKRPENRITMLWLPNSRSLTRGAIQWIYMCDNHMQSKSQQISPNSFQHTIKLPASRTTFANHAYLYIYESESWKILFSTALYRSTWCFFSNLARSSFRFASSSAHGVPAPSSSLLLRFLDAGFFKAPLRGPLSPSLASPSSKSFSSSSSDSSSAGGFMPYSPSHFFNCFRVWAVM